MPVTTTHPDYDTHHCDWEQCRTAANGSRAIKDAGEKFLPKLTEQDQAEYDAYKMRALWYGATARTIQGLGGSIFRKAMQLDVPTAIEEHAKDITMTGVTLETFCKKAVNEVLTVGRYGILVDMPKEVDGIAPEQSRPYWVGYTAEQITNWHTSRVGSETVLTQVVLFENHLEADPTDQFVVKSVPQYRVLRLVNKEYMVEIWRKKKVADGDSEEWSIHETISPTFRRKPLEYIPFCFIGPTDVEPSPEKPPLLDLVDVNLSHYRSSADLEHGRHFTALPTAWVAGFPTEDGKTKLRIGSDTAWVSDRPEAHCGMLEFTGQGLGALEKALEHKEALMAILGARMLEPQKKSVESADTHNTRQAGETSALQGLAGSVEIAFTRCLTWHAMWMGQADPTVTLELNKVFTENRMQPAELAELVKTWQAGGMSDETLYWNMQRGELTRPGVDFEEEKELIDAQAPARLALTDDPNLDPDLPIGEEEEETEGAAV